MNTQAAVAQILDLPYELHLGVIDLVSDSLDEDTYFLTEQQKQGLLAADAYYRKYPDTALPFDESLHRLKAKFQ